MKELIRKFVSFSMALLLLASTTSWKVEKHYCMGHLVDAALFSSASGCGMNADSAGTLKMSCCDDETIVIEGQDDLSITWDDDAPVLSFQFVIPPVATYAQLPLESKLRLPNEYYPPPLLVRNIQLLDQVFLI